MIVIVTARRGSKRCPNKNVLPFDGTNLIARTLRQARFLNPEKIILTTDYTWSEVWDGNAPVMFDEKEYMHYFRPRKLCKDGISSEAVVKDAIRSYLIKEGKRGLDTFCLLQPTSPLRAVETLVRAKILFEEKNFSALVSVNPAYQPNGSFYFCIWDAFLMEHSLYPKGSHFWICNWKESADINYPWEFRIAEALDEGGVHGNL